MSQQPTSDVRRRNSNIPFSLKSTGSKELYEHYSAIVQQLYTEAEIVEMWNHTQAGRPSQPQTVRRWLQPGPYEKNPNFEGFIMGIYTTSWMKVKRNIREELIHKHGKKGATMDIPTLRIDF